MIKKWIRKFFNRITINEEDVLEAVRNTSRNVSRNNSAEKYVPKSQIAFFKDKPNEEFGAVVSQSNVVIQHFPEEEEKSEYTKVVKEKNFLNEKNYGHLTNKIEVKNKEIYLKLHEDNNVILDLKKNLKMIELRQNVKIKKRSFSIVEEYEKVELPNRISKDDYDYTYNSFTLDQKKLFYDMLFMFNLKENFNLMKFENLYDESRKTMIKGNKFSGEIESNKEFKKICLNLEKNYLFSQSDNADLFIDQKKELEENFIEEMDKILKKKMKKVFDESILKDEFSSVDIEILTNIYENNKKRYLKKFWAENISKLQPSFEDALINMRLAPEEFELSVNKRNIYGEEGIDDILNNLIL